MRFLVYADFKAKGIGYSRQHVKWLVKKKKFPPPVKGVCKENAWTEPVIDQYVEERVAAARGIDKEIAAKPARSPEARPAA